MGLTYDGITYRSLEEQVRYDAEQIQLLKQADVTINENLQTVNENLQTVNTELNGKLTKPTNPSAESAVTMLADGTVGTKPLSEIGGGGKLYLHYILKTTGDIPVYFSLWSSSVDELTTIDKLFEYYKVPQYQNRLIPCSCGGISTNKIGVLILDYTTGMGKTAQITFTDNDGVKTVTISDGFTDIVIEV